MVARAYTVAFQGIDARIVEVQCALSAGMPAFSIVTLVSGMCTEQILIACFVVQENLIKTLAPGIRQRQPP